MLPTKTNAACTIKALLWCFWVYHSLNAVTSVEAGSFGGIMESSGKSSSFFGILGNAFSDACCRKDDDETYKGLSSSSSYIRLGRMPLTTANDNSLPERWEDQIESMKAPNQASRDDSNPIEDTEIQAWLGGNGRPSKRRRLSRSQEAICLETSLTATASPKTDITGLTSPIIPLSISLEGQTGDEFADPTAIDSLATMGLNMATQESNNDWIEWKMHSSTKKLMEQNHQNELAVLEQGEVLVYIGTCKKEGHGSTLPIIKTKSILPLSAVDMADLLMDSSKVKIYNKLSMGRSDVADLGENTKVVCNLTKPPIAKSNMVSCTLMHSRNLNAEGSKCLVVSRAMPGQIDSSLEELPRNDILLGVNLLEDRLATDECIMTAVTHVYSPALPTLLAKKMGVSSAINFVKDIRNSCQGVEN